MHKSVRAVIDRVRSDARDGTLAEVLQAPVVGWHARNELPAFFRDRREVRPNVFCLSAFAASAEGGRIY